MVAMLPQCNISSFRSQQVSFQSSAWPESIPVSLKDMKFLRKKTIKLVLMTGSVLFSLTVVIK